MRLMYIQNMRLPTEKAHGYQIMKTCEALALQGTDLRLVVTDRKTPITQEPFGYYGIKPSFGVIKIPVWDFIGSAPKTFSSLAFAIERLSFYRNLKNNLLKDADAYYTRDPWLAPKLKKLIGKRIFLEMHAMPNEQTMSKLKSLDGVLCVTKWMQHETERFLPGMRTAFVPDAVDLDVYDPPESREQARQALGLSAEEKIVLYGGRFSTMEQGKGLILLDEAVAEIARLDPRAKLILVGGTAAEFQRIEGRKTSESTICINAVPRRSLAMYYRAADVLAMPFPNTRHYAYEMSPLKLFEYMASGTPIVTSDLPSVREILDQTSAVFYLPESLPALIEALRRAMDDDGRLAKHAKGMVGQFTWQERGRRILECIKK